MEFGKDITTSVVTQNNISTDMSPHLLDKAGIFMSPLQAHHNPARFEHSLRFTVIRDPVKRAVSSFRYLCRAHEEHSPHFAPLRLRMSALVGFDWETDINSTVGLEKMVSYVALAMADKQILLDPHIAPQTASLHPALFRPYMTGRMEELPRFLSNLAEELGATEFRAPKNKMRNAGGGHNAIMVNRRLRTLIEEVFREDMDWYDNL